MRSLTNAASTSIGGMHSVPMVHNYDCGDNPSPAYTPNSELVPDPSITDSSTIPPTLMRTLLGAVNGVATSCTALARALAPVLTGSLLGWTLENRLPAPLDYHLPWLFLAGIVLASSLMTGFFPKGMDIRIEDREATEQADNGQEMEAAGAKGNDGVYSRLRDGSVGNTPCDPDLESSAWHGNSSTGVVPAAVGVAKGDTGASN